VLKYERLSYIKKSKSSREELKESASVRRRTSRNDILTQESRKKWTLTKKALVKKKKIL
jgi:hypothetical protein